MSPQARLDDGLLDVVVMEGYGFRATMKHVLLAMLGRHARDPDVHLYRARRIEVETRDTMPVHLDAESVGFTPVTVEIVPRALKIIVPQNAPLNLFTIDD
ncbi:MAG: hypothetical protein D6796_09485 [Caldilineae bacterium]|nr:MAG: hypothetical protein D6796_09485 [Caldilineae bacterium]